MNRRAIAALLTSLLALTGTATSASAQNARPDATAPSVRLAGELIKTAAEPGEPVHAAVRMGTTLVPVRAKGVTRADSGDRVSIDVIVPAKVRDAARSATPLRVKNGQGKTDTFDVDQRDLAAAADSTPEPAQSDIGVATVKLATSPGGEPLEVGEVTTITQSQASYVPAERKVVAVSVVPANLGWNQPTNTEMLSAVSGSDSFWRDNSRDELKVSVSQVTMGVTSAYSCSNPFGLWNDVASQVGYTRKADTSLVLFLPKGADTSGCSYGLGTIGDSPNSWGYVYVSDPNSDVIAHEVGHNMSLMHANSLVCSTDQDTSNTAGSWSSCSRRDYGDGQDVMGVDNTSTPSGMLSSPQALRLGTLEQSAATAVPAGTSTVTLKPLAGRIGTRAATVSNSDNGVTYYVEYRTPSGRDLYNSWGQQTGVRILRVDPSDDSSVLLDPTPTGSTSDSDPTLRPGSTFTSYDGAVQVSTVSTSSTEAVVKIINGGGMPRFSEITAPIITGTPKVGGTLTVSTGAWSPTPTSYSYQWRRDGALVPGATASTYVPTSVDAGAVLTAEVTARLSGYRDAATTADGVTIPRETFTNGVAPTITGTPAVWADLAVDLGQWSPTPTSYSYDWRINGQPSFFGKESTYTVWPDDAGATITVRVTAHRAGYEDKTVETRAVTVPLRTFTLFTRPQISGTPKIGETLHVDEGSWSGLPDTATYQWRRNGQSIPGATTPDYVVTSADAGAQMTATVTVSASGYADASSTSAAVTVPLSTFTNTSYPTISGTPKIGSPLTATAGSWTPIPTTTGYQWNRNGSPIAGATTTTYTPTTGDAGESLSVTITAKRTGYTDATKTSALVVVPTVDFTNSTPPTISGTPKIGSPLTATAGSWTPIPTTTSYQWNRNGSPIAGATATTYTPTTSDAGKGLSVTTTAKREGYTDATSTSAAVAVPMGVFSAPAPKVTGTKAVGKTLTASVGTWSPTPTSYSYRWKRNGVSISGAAGKSYTLTRSDAGRYITITVTARRTGYTPKSVTSAKAGIPTYNTTRPAITGTLRAGRTLTVSKGSWTPLPSTYAYQWYRDGRAISGATSRTYTVRSTDRGRRISAKVTVRRSGYVTGTAYSYSKTIAR